MKEKLKYLKEELFPILILWVLVIGFIFGLIAGDKHRTQTQTKMQGNWDMEVEIPECGSSLQVYPEREGVLTIKCNSIPVKGAK